ncbi:MAG: DUF1285 domain-containing protein [Rhodobacteraceae bacterium]|nr:DUF1285 domain-containing protein [Paracoccaceae bacterium]
MSDAHSTKVKHDAPSAEGVAAAAAQAGRKGPPPVHLWNPPFCGDLDIRITRDGLWYYLGTPIGREALVRLFASVLRRDEDDRYYLVTPVEKVGIQVEDVPFVAVDVVPSGVGGDRRLMFETNVGDWVAAGAEHPLRVERDLETGEPTPYVHVRGRLEARIDRKSFYRLVDLGEVVAKPEGRLFGVWSDGSFFALADAAELDL